MSGVWSDGRSGPSLLVGADPVACAVRRERQGARRRCSAGVSSGYMRAVSPCCLPWILVDVGGRSSLPVGKPLPSPAKPAEDGDPDFGATPSVNRRIEVQPCDREAGVMRSAFTHRSLTRTAPERSIRYARNILEVWGDSSPPSCDLRGKPLVPMPFGACPGHPLPPG